MKKIISLIMIAVVLFTVTSCGNKVAENFAWKYNEGTLTVSGNGMMPSYIDENGDLTSRPWDENVNAIEFIVIEDGITSVGDSAFTGMKKVIEVTFPDNIEVIGKDAFKRCININQMEIPSSIRTIEDGAFSFCNSLASITLSEGVESIGEYAFKGCITLCDIVIPKSVKSIGEGAFETCRMLNNIEFKGTVSQWEAFGDSLGIKSGVTVKCSDGEAVQN